MFIHHPDGYVIINGLLVDIETWQRWEPEYRPPPEGYRGRIYQPGVRHDLLDALGNATQQALPDAAFDRYIEQEARYRRLAARQGINLVQKNELTERVKPYGYRQRQRTIRGGAGLGGGRPAADTGQSARFERQVL